MTEIVRFRLSRAVLALFGVLLGSGVLAVLAWIAGWEFGPIVFEDEPALDRAVLLSFAILVGAISAFGLLCAALGLPSLRISPQEIVRTDVLGRRTVTKLATLGPAHLASFGDHELIAFYTAERERALRQAGRYEAPDKLTADLTLNVHNLRGERLTSPEQICRFINENREDPSDVAGVRPEALAEIVRDHQKRVQLRRLLIPLGAAAAFGIEQLADAGELTATAAYVALAVGLVVFFLDSLQQRGGILARVASWAYAGLALSFVALTLNDIVAAL